MTGPRLVYVCTFRSHHLLVMYVGKKVQCRWSWGLGFAWKFTDRTRKLKPWESFRGMNVLWNEALGRATIIDFHRSRLNFWPAPKITSKETTAANESEGASRLPVL